MAQKILGQDYISTFLTSHHPFDYAREYIIYPRTDDLYREYTSSEIQQFRSKTPWSKKPLRLRRCRPSLLEYHLRKASKTMKDGFPEWTVAQYISGRGEIEKIYGCRWILVTYYDDAFVNFIQLDIDRHGLKDEEKARTQVKKLKDAASTHGFDIIWTTSPGYQDDDGSMVHGLYAWIRLDKNHFVMDIRPYLIQFLVSIGLKDIAHEQEGAYLKQKKLVRLPGQFNVELADPDSFSKIYQHTPLDAIQVFQDAWKSAVPLKSEILTSISPQSPPKCVGSVISHSSVTPSPLSPHGNTFTKLLRWGRGIVNEVFPDRSKENRCVQRLIERAGDGLASDSKTRNDPARLELKARGVIHYLFENTDASLVRNRQATDDISLFAPHARYIQEHRDQLYERLPERLHHVAAEILHMLLKYHGRVAAKSIYHGSPTPICTYRNWKLIQERWGLITLIEYEKQIGESKGTCKMWGFKSVSKCA